VFEIKTNSKVEVILFDTCKALDQPTNGDVDAMLVQSSFSEDKFFAEGHSINRRDVMYDDFTVVEPDGDLGGIKAGKGAVAVLKKIVDRREKFISRGGNFGADQLKKGYWKQVYSQPQGSSCVPAGVGMGEALNMPAELKAYTLTDRSRCPADVREIRLNSRIGSIAEVRNLTHPARSGRDDST
jgi:tungstate transport system substrate-binding protein